MNIDKLKELLNSNKLNLCNIKKEIETLKDLDNDHEIEYLKDLLDPINRKNVKIPSKNPVPTVTVQMKTYSDIMLNPQGETLISICPFFLADNTYYNKVIEYRDDEYKYEFHVKYLTTCCQFDRPVFSDENKAFNLNKNIEPGIYVKYRLVSAALKVIYTGNVGGVCGTINGGTLIENDKKVLCFGRVVEDGESEDPHGEIVPSIYYYDYDFVETINKMIYHQENNCIDGLTMIYFPVDNSYLEFCNVVNINDIYWPGDYIQNKIHGTNRPVLYCKDDCFKGNFRWIVHISNGPTIQSNCFRFEMYCNFECIPSPKVLNYMPVSINSYFLNDEIVLKIINKIKEYINENNI